MGSAWASSGASSSPSWAPPGAGSRPSSTWSPGSTGRLLAKCSSTAATSGAPARRNWPGTAAARQRARELLAQLGIADQAARYPARLSGGQQQRVAIARALVNRPLLLLADEPTGALDSRSGEQVMELLVELNRGGQTVLLVTHDAKLAARHARRVVSLVDGKVADDVVLQASTASAAELVRVRVEEVVG